MTTANQTRDRLDVRSVRERLLAPTAPYYLLIGATSLLTVLGLVMVLSASSVTSYTGTGSSFTVFKSQAIYAGIGVILATIASFVPPRWWKRLALPIYVFAILAELLVFTSLGATINGNRNWIAFGGYTAQPSEVGKFAIVLVGALVLTAKRKRLAETKHVLIPLVFPLGLVLIGLVIAGHDLGTTMVLGAILAAVMFTAGVRARVFVMGAGAAALLLGAAVLTSGNRTSRLDSWLGTCMDAESRAGVCFQAMHGQFALADGGWWGVGLGASREKWGLLPEAHNDFIFAIIGEELGLPGTLIVIALYAIIGFACYRIIASSTDFFVRVATGGVMVWVLMQAVINIASVTGLLPIIGVPLPLVSSGGSALITTLLGLGMVISFARHEPECRAALSQRAHWVKRTTAVLPTRKAPRS